MTRLVEKHVPKSALLNQTAQELTYVLPHDAVGKGQFPSLFAALKEKKASLDVQGFGLMDSTLEEVFLKVAEMSADSGQGKSIFILFTYNLIFNFNLYLSSSMAS